MGVDSVNFTWFMRTMCEFSEIWVIHSNCVEFSADGQESESMELIWMNFVAKSARFTGIVCKLSEICMVHWNFARKAI